MERASLSSADGGEDLLSTRFLLIALVFVGCSSPNNTLPYPLIISENGLGAIHPDTPFEQISTSLSGFEFEKLSQISPQYPEMIYQMKRGDTLIAHIVSDSSGKKISEIHILSPLIKNKHHLGLGETIPQNTPINCRDELCSYPDEPSVYYRIDSNTRTIREITFQKL
jgi:hypothetical protein